MSIIHYQFVRQHEKWQFVSMNHNYFLYNKKTEGAERPLLFLGGEGL